MANDHKLKIPRFTTREQLTDQQWHLLTESNTFCMYPWTHMHAFPDGRVFPCCVADTKKPLGDLRTNTMAEVWNQEAYRTLRRNMLSEVASGECFRCYEQEQHGQLSMRNLANRDYAQHIDELDMTTDDGAHPEFKIRYWDVRFSNLCNFSCRTCGPSLSSNWYNEHVKIHKSKPNILGREMSRVEYTTGDEDSMVAQMMPHIPYLEEVYFAGGEPLIMKEHYFMLEKLIEAGKTDITIIYNTNFSELAFKDKNVFDYWRHFKNVSVGASLDASGARAELIRKGQSWAQVLENRHRMMEQAPDVHFYITPTISSLNILHILDFHREWTHLGLIEAKDCNVNICQHPAWYRIDIFPEQFKQQVIIPAYVKHIEWLKTQYGTETVVNGFSAALSLIRSVDNSAAWPTFVERTAILDKSRDEDFWSTFPEYAEIKNYEFT